MDVQFTFIFEAIPQIFLSIFVLAQGTIILLQNRKNPLHRYFFLFELAVSIWMLFMGMAYLATNVDLALMLEKIGFIGVMFIPIATLTFSAHLANKAKEQRNYLLIGIVLTLFVASLINNPLIVLGTYHYNWGYYIQLGILGWLPILLFAFGISIFAKNLYYIYRNSTEQSSRRKMVLITGLMSYFGIIDFLPGYGLAFSQLPPLGFIFVGTFPTIMGYYLMRYRLSDLKIIAGRGIGYTLMSATLLLVYTSIFAFLISSQKSTTEILLESLFFIIAIYLFSYIKELSQGIIDQIFFREKINFESVISRFNLNLQNLQTRKILLTQLFSFVKEVLRIDKISIATYHQNEKKWYIYDSQNDLNTPLIIPGEFTSEEQKFFTLKTEAKEIIPESIYISENRGNKVIETLVGITKTNLIIPLINHGECKGFLLFGKKESERVYSPREKTELIHLTATVSIAWENAGTYEETLRANETKIDFASIVSHQLRTPLTRVKWALNAMTESESIKNLNEEQVSMLKNISQSNEIIIGIVNQLLGVFETEIQTQNIKGVSNLKESIQDTLDERKEEIKKKGLDFDIDLKDYNLMIEKKFLKIILDVIIDNAINYSLSKSVIKIRENLDESRKNAIISIENSGIGINENDQKNIFNKFYRANNAVDQRPDGTGLGLYYAKLLLGKNDGQIWFDSKENVGATFYFSLPITNN